MQSTKCECVFEWVCMWLFNLKAYVEYYCLIPLILEETGRKNKLTVKVLVKLKLEKRQCF